LRIILFYRRLAVNDGLRQRLTSDLFLMQISRPGQQLSTSSPSSARLLLYCAPALFPHLSTRTVVTARLTGHLPLEPLDLQLNQNTVTEPFPHAPWGTATQLSIVQSVHAGAGQEDAGDSASEYSFVPSSTLSRRMMTRTSDLRSRLRKMVTRRAFATTIVSHRAVYKLWSATILATL
jgi:hypothetical protein